MFMLPRSAIYASSRAATGEGGVHDQGEASGDALATDPDTPITHLATNLAQEHGGSPRTWERLLTQARQA